MVQRNKGTGLPRLAIGSLNAPGIQPAMPAQQSNTFAQFTEGIINLAGGAAGSFSQSARAKNKQTILDETDQAIDALMAGEQAPIFTTNQAQEFYDKSLAYQIANDTDVETIELTPGEKPSEAMQRFVTEGPGAALTPQAQLQLSRYLQPRYADMLARQSRQAKVELYAEQVPLFAGRAASEDDFGSVMADREMLYQIGKANGQTKADVDIAWSSQAFNIAIETGNVDRAKQIAKAIETTLPERAIQAVSKTKDRLADIFSEDIKQRLRQGESLEAILPAIHAAANEDHITETAADRLLGQAQGEYAAQLSSHMPGQLTAGDSPQSLSAGYSAVNKNGWISTSQMNSLNSDLSQATQAIVKGQVLANAHTFTASHLDNFRQSGGASVLTEGDIIAAAGGKPEGMTLEKYTDHAADNKFAELGEENLPTFVEYLSGNGMTYYRFEGILEGGYSASTNFAATTDGEYKPPVIIDAGYQLYKKLRAIDPKLANKHISVDAQTFYRDRLTAEEGGAEPNEQVTRAIRASEYKSGLTVSAKQIETEFAGQLKFDPGWLSLEKQIYNYGDIVPMFMRWVNHDIASTGNSPARAIANATERFDSQFEIVNGFAVHVGNRVIPRDFEKVSDYIIEQYIAYNPGEADAEDLAIAPAPNGLWQIVNMATGGRPVEAGFVDGVGAFTAPQLAQMGYAMAKQNDADDADAYARGQQKKVQYAEARQQQTNNRGSSTPNYFPHYERNMRIPHPKTQDPVAVKARIAEVKTQLEDTPPGTSVMMRDQYGRWVVYSNQKSPSGTDGLTRYAGPELLTSLPRGDAGILADLDRSFQKKSQSPEQVAQRYIPLVDLEDTVAKYQLTMVQHDKQIDQMKSNLSKAPTGTVLVYFKKPPELLHPTENGIIFLKRTDSGITPVKRKNLTDQQLADMIVGPYLAEDQLLLNSIASAKGTR